MSKEQIILLTIFSVIVGVSAAIGIVLPYLKAKGVNVKEILDKLQKGLEEVKTGLAVVKEVAPNTPQLDTLETVEKWAEIGVKKAQQLYISSQLTGDQRNQAAKDTIVAALQELNIPVSDNLKQIISDTVESKVFDLKTPEEIKTQETKTVQDTTVTLQQQVTQLQADKVQLQSTNAQLAQKITSMQNAVTQAVAQ